MEHIICVHKIAQSTVQLDQFALRLIQDRAEAQMLFSLLFQHEEGFLLHIQGFDKLPANAKEEDNKYRLKLDDRVNIASAHRALLPAQYTDDKYVSATELRTEFEWGDFEGVRYTFSLFPVVGHSKYLDSAISHATQQPEAHRGDYYSPMYYDNTIWDNYRVRAKF